MKNTFGLSEREFRTRLPRRPQEHCDDIKALQLSISKLREPLRERPGIFVGKPIRSGGKFKNGFHVEATSQTCGWFASKTFQVKTFECKTNYLSESRYFGETGKFFDIFPCFQRSPKFIQKFSESSSKVLPKVLWKFFESSLNFLPKYQESWFKTEDGRLPVDEKANSRI